MFVLSHEWNVFLILLIIIAISLASWWTVKVHLEKEWRARLDAESGNVISKIQQEFQGYSQALSDSRAYFQIGGIPSGREFQRYVESSELFRRFPGLQGLAFAQKFTPETRASLENKLHGEGYTEFKHWPEGERSLYTAITLIQPEDWRNKKALGYDMYSDPVRREAMDKALKTSQPAMTDPVTLVQDSTEAFQSGLLIYLPVLKERMEKVPNQEDLLGFVYAIVSVNRFFNGTLGVPQFYNEKINYRLESFDRRLGKSVPLYERFDSQEQSNPRTDVVLEKEVKVFDKTWHLTFEPLPHFFNWYERYIPILFAFVTLVMLSVIFLALWSTQQFLKFSERHKESLAQISKNKSDEILLIRRLNAVIADLSSVIDAGPLFEKFTEHLKSIFSIADCVVYVREEHGPFEKRFEVQAGEFPESLNLPLDFDQFLAERFFDTRSKSEGLPKLLSWFSPQVRRILDSAPYYIIRSVLHESGKSTSILVLMRGTTQNAVEGTIMEYALTSMVGQFAMSYDKAILLRRAEDANVMKSSFLANMSHEIRTPLGVIVGYSEILAEESLDAQEKQQIVKSVKRNGKELARLIDDILDISKVEAGKLHFEMAQVNLEGLVHEIKSIMEVRASDRKIQFNVAKLSNVPRYIVTDDIRLKQILINVVGNAVKFTEKGGVKLLYKVDSEGGAEEFLEFQIQDSGIGISERNRQHLFKPFSQGDVSTTRKYGGTGLGLALSKRLAELLGGDLFLLESSVGKGSTFSLRIPLRKTSVDMAVARSGDLNRNMPSLDDPSPRPIDWASLDLKNLLQGVRILLVEDSEDNQEIFEHFLTSAGAEVKIAADGERAIEVAFQVDPDLILMDIQIPKIDGKQATREIRHKGFKKPIVALTAHALTEEIESCLEAGCNGQITKPVSGELLVQEVYFYLNHRG